MRKEHICSFCHPTNNRGERAFYNKPLLTSKSYFVLPSIGAIVPGWTLIIPFTHSVNLATQYKNHELTSFRIQIAKQLRYVYGRNVCMFEHGAVNRGSATGCGVDHAHLHLVPISEPLLSFFDAVDNSLQWFDTRSEDIHTHVQGSEYLMYSRDATSASPSCLVAKLDRPISQYFRRVIAHAVGAPSMFDYKSYEFIHNVRDTIKSLDKGTAIYNAQSDISVVADSV